MAITNEQRLRLKELLNQRDISLRHEIFKLANSDLNPADVIFLNKVVTSEKYSTSKGDKPIRIALIGGYTFQPFADFLNFYLSNLGFTPSFFIGEFDNYAAEILAAESPLIDFKPDLALLVPSARRHSYRGSQLDSLEIQRAEINDQVREIHSLCTELNTRIKAPVLLTNFALPNENHYGPIKHRGYGSDWVFRKVLNVELGLCAPSFVSIIDVEYLSAELGVAKAEDRRAWYEAKQLGSMPLLQSIAREVSRTVSHLKSPAKKVIVLDLDNTLWGGVIGDDDLNGIELGDTSARGEAFKDFQRFIKKLKNRGFLLAVCSKNEESAARKPFLQHPEMVLKLEDIVSFRANWNSKADNINEIAASLNLGTDSMIFIDDNPAEVAIVNQFLPDVSTIHLTSDPADFIGILNASGLFRQATITSEDLEKTELYQIESKRAALKESVTDMGAYLEGLGMRAVINKFSVLDAPRISQLINKSNQFNLTTRRRTEAEVAALLGDKTYACFTVRLSDRFGDYGLISVVICKITSDALIIDSLLMSCRVLERGVEQEIFNKLERIAVSHDLPRILGDFIPSSKNAMVRNLYSKYGFELIDETDERSRYQLAAALFRQIPTAITIEDVT